MNSKPKMTDLVNTLDIIEAVRALNLLDGKPDSDYYIAKTLEISHATVGNYKSGTTMQDDIAVRAAKLLEWDAELVLQCLCLEASEKYLKDDVSKVWKKSLDKKFAAYPLLFVALSAVQFLEYVGSTV